MRLSRKSGGSPVPGTDLREKKRWFSSLFRRRESGDILSEMQTQLSRLRWIATAEAVNIVRSQPDPADWPDGEMVFELERSTAHEHEALRDDLAQRVSRRVAVVAARIYDRAAAIARRRSKLHDIDTELVRKTHDWREVYMLIKHDDQELARYQRSRSSKSQSLKWGVAIVLIAAEFMLTQAAFAGLFSVEWFRFVVVIGTMVMLIVVPHYVALGIKDGQVHHYASLEKAYRERGLEPPSRIGHMARREGSEDRVFIWAGVGMMVLITALAVALGLIRTYEVSGSYGSLGLWAVFYVSLQLAISGYFFFREYQDYGNLAGNLKLLSERREKLIAKRQRILAGLADDMAAFEEDAEELLEVYESFPRWDSYVVDEYLATVHWIRHVVSTQLSEIAPLVSLARIPYLGAADEVDPDDRVDPIWNEHRALADDSLRGRDWRIERIGDQWAVAFGQEAGVVSTHADAQDFSWMIRRNPGEMLKEFLDRYFDIEVDYDSPEELEIGEITTEEANTHIAPDAAGSGAPPKFPENESATDTDVLQFNPDGTDPDHPLGDDTGSDAV